jgi:hypothetical protein
MLPLSDADTHLVLPITAVFDPLIAVLDNGQVVCFCGLTAIMQYFSVELPYLHPIITESFL